MRRLGLAGRSGQCGPRDLEQDAQSVSFQIMRVRRRLYESGPRNQSQNQGIGTSNKGNGNCQVKE